MTILQYYDIIHLSLHLDGATRRSSMYNDGQILGASIPPAGAVAVLPFTSGNTAFQLVLLAVVVISVAVIAVRLYRLNAERKAQ